LIAAAVSLWESLPDAAFVAAALGAVMWFLGLRSRMKESIRATDEATKPDDSDSEDSQ
jgi:hypothetical protein